MNKLLNLRTLGAAFLLLETKSVTIAISGGPFIVHAAYAADALPHVAAFGWAWSWRWT